MPDLLAQGLFLLFATAVVLLLVRRFVPYLGDQLWRWYCAAIVWLLRAPFRLVRFLLREVFTRNRL